MQYLDEKLQAKVVDEDVADGHEEIPDNLCSSFQCGTRKTDVARHPEACEEGDGELEYESCDVGREGDEAEVKDLAFKDEMVENIVQHPL